MFWKEVESQTASFLIWYLKTQEDDPLLVTLQILIFSPFSFHEDIVHLSSIFTFLNSDAYLSEVQVIRHALYNVYGAEQIDSFYLGKQYCLFLLHECLAFHFKKLEKETAFVICKVSVIL